MGDAGELDPIATEILAPLVALRARYLATQQLITRLLDSLAPFVESRTGPAPVPPSRSPSPEAARTGRGPVRAALDVESDEIGVLLDFQERLATLEGVESIAVAGTTSGGTRLIVELADVSPEPAPFAPVDIGLPTLLCAWCGKLMRAGTRDISHGLCEDCAASVLGTNPSS